MLMNGKNLTQQVQLLLAVKAMTPFKNLIQCINSFLLQCLYAKHATTGERPSKLFKNRALCTNMHNVSSADVAFFKGTRLEMADRAVMQDHGYQYGPRRWVGSSWTL